MKQFLEDQGRMTVAFKVGSIVDDVINLQLTVATKRTTLDDFF